MKKLGEVFLLELSFLFFCPYNGTNPSKLNKKQGRISMLFLDVYLLSGGWELCIMQGKGNILYTNKF